MHLEIRLFIVSLFISTGVLLNQENIIFSNLFIPKMYNKGGSIYRTIRKIIPLFDYNRALFYYNINTTHQGNRLTTCALTKDSKMYYDIEET